MRWTSARGPWSALSVAARLAAVTPLPSGRSGLAPSCVQPLASDPREEAPLSWVNVERVHGESERRAHLDGVRAL
eukprot:5084497-Pyramimonas_sp.AAC.1